MTIKNTEMGGEDWLRGATLLPVDLNDTFDEIDRVVNLGN